MISKAGTAELSFTPASTMRIRVADDRLGGQKRDGVTRDPPRTPPNRIDTLLILSSTPIMRVSAGASGTVPLRYNLIALNFGTVARRAPAWRFVLFLVGLSAGQAQLDLHTCKVRNIEAKCGSFTVPENRAEPHGRSIRLSIEVLMRAAQTSDSEPLFMLAGGPGGSATELSGFAAESLALVRSAHDTVLMGSARHGRIERLGVPA